jgi:iron complex outermembrane receptor protein
VKVANVLVGADARVYELIPDGNNFVDFSRPIADRNTALADGSFGSNTYYKKFGGFVQATKTFFDDKLKLNGSLRVDDNPEFTVKFTPRLAAVYTSRKNTISGSHSSKAIVSRIVRSIVLCKQWPCETCRYFAGDQ